MYENIDAYLLRLMRESGPDRTAWNIERVRQGKPANWNYIDGCMMTALLEMDAITGDPRYFTFVESFIDSFAAEDGAIRTYDKAKFNLDDVNEGRVLFPLYRRTGKEKYRLAAETLHAQLEEQPRTWEGSFWHKRIYPNQVWLDGLYMAQPFAVLYALTFGAGDVSDTLRQVRTVEKRMKDPKTGLYYHGYDASKTAFWADKETGLSRSFWLRSIGWFSVALADMIGFLPEGEARGELTRIFRDLMESLLPFADPATGLYWQVPDQPGREGNYRETSGSSMLAYAMLKGARLGVLEPRFARAGQKTFEGIVSTCLTFTESGLELGGICLVAGLGPEDNRRRDGSYAYYISEPVVRNDAKGVAPFLLAYTEIKRIQKHE